MAYIYVNTDKIDFVKEKQTKTITVNTDSSLKVNVIPTWLTAVITGDQVALSVHKNDKYVELTGNLVLGIDEDKDVFFQIVVTQESADDDSQSVFLVDVIDNIMIESGDDNSYMNGVKRHHAILLAKRLMQDLNYDCLREIRAYEATITAANKVIPPIDYVDYVRVSLVTESGSLIPIFVNNKLNISKKYVKDNNEELIVDNLGYPIYATGSRRTTPSYGPTKYFIQSPTVDSEYLATNALYGIKGGQASYTGSYRYDAQAKEFILDNVPEEFKTVVIEYLSDPIASEMDPRKIRIHKYFQTTLETGIYYRYIDKLRNVPMNEKERARREYYNEVRKAMRRINTKPDELRQKMGSDVGFNKML